MKQTMSRMAAAVLDQALRHQLGKFSRIEWTRASWVLLKNPQVKPWVTAGYLESRPDPTYTGTGAHPVVYRLTDAGARFLNATKESA